MTPKYLINPCKYGSHQPRPEPATEVVEFPPDSSRPERLVRIGDPLAPSVKETIVSLLQQYQDVFAFGPSEMPGIATDDMQHRLNVDSSHKPVIKKRRHLGTERTAATAVEVKKVVGSRLHRRVPPPRMCQTSYWSRSQWNLANVYQSH